MLSVVCETKSHTKLHHNKVLWREFRRETVFSISCLTSSHFLAARSTPCSSKKCVEYLQRPSTAACIHPLMQVEAKSNCSCYTFAFCSCSPSSAISPCIESLTSVFSPWKQRSRLGGVAALATSLALPLHRYKIYTEVSELQMSLNNYYQLSGHESSRRNASVVPWRRRPTTSISSCSEIDYDKLKTLCVHFPLTER